MSVSCIKTVDKLNKAIDDVNTMLIDNMTDPTLKYDWVCIKPNVTYQFYYESLRDKWEKIINDFIEDPDKCSDNLSKLLELYRVATPEKIAEARKVFDALTSGDDSSMINLDNIVLDVVATNIMKEPVDVKYHMDKDFSKALVDLSDVLVKNCQCQMVDIFKTVIRKYKNKYHQKFEGKTKDEVIELLRKDYNKFKELLKKISREQKIEGGDKFIDGLTNQLTGLYGFSVESELDNLIPNELGSLKDFFIKVISEYFNNLHPIIWAQIFKSLTENVFIDLPYTPDEIFSFVSKYLLLNSGPFILKILQMIRPVLSPELAKKYNLTKLTYPLLKPHQIDLMLKKVVYQWDMYKVEANFSASVGHVSKVVKVNKPSDSYMIKMIKPLAVAQSCWEYKTLYDIFPEGSCEQAFVINMLDSNGVELDVNNEIKNIDDGYKYYTGDYKDIFGYDIDASLTTIENVPDVIVPGTWFALGMTIAPGVPLSKLIEGDMLENDTIYRAKLHRCLDILIYKFFLNIIKNGYYHGDLHSGNIFFSFEQNQMTLIDFGAVGRINIYSDDSDIRTMLDIVVMSLFNNFPDMFDTMTDLLNSKCTETQIDKNTPEYREFKEKLLEYRINNFYTKEKDKENSQKYQKDIFSEKRIKEENSAHYQAESNGAFDSSNVDSIYSYLEYKPKGPETIIENRDVLPPFPKIEKSGSVGFTEVLEEMIKFYALSGVNIAIKFNELYEFQKAYTLLLGVLYKAKYNGYRTGFAINKAIKRWENIPELRHLGTVQYMIRTYWDQKKKNAEFEKNLTGKEPISDSVETANDTVVANDTIITNDIRTANNLTDTESNKMIADIMKRNAELIDEYGENAMKGGRYTSHYKFKNKIH